MDPIRTLRHAAEGFGMGLANVIPGVSGGTMALIFGIYEELVQAVRDAVTASAYLAKLDFRGFLENARKLPWSFLGPLLVGIIAAPLLGAGLLKTLLATYPVAMRAVFFGLILGSIPVPWLRMTKPGAPAWIVAVLSAAAAYLLAGLPPREMFDPASWQIFASAAVAICAMILPGISGAYVLLVLGMYAPTMTAIDELNPGFLALFVLGAGFGLGSFAILLNWLLKRYHDTIMAVLVGLMAGSLRALWPWQTGTTPRLPDAGEPVLTIVLLAGGGLLVTVALAAWGAARTRRAMQHEAASD